MADWAALVIRGISGLVSYRMLLTIDVEGFEMIKATVITLRQKMSMPCGKLSMCA